MREFKIGKKPKNNSSLPLMYKFQTKSLMGFKINFEKKKAFWKRKYIRITKNILNRE